MTAATQIVTGVDFVGIPTRDLDAALHFYGEVLGLPRTVLREGLYAEFETGNCTLSVMHAENMGLKHEPLKSHLALHVDDMDAAIARMRENDIEVRGHGGEPPFDTGVCHMAFIRDPDGNALMLHHRYKPR